MTQQAADFVNALCDVHLDHVFNPYTDHCPLFDREDAATKRRQNLERSLASAIDLEVRTIWIARDLGYRGGRRTGLALTDEMHLDAYSTLFRGLPVERATKGPPVGERTANTIWRMLARVGQPVFLWNVFPLHPHAPEEPMTNRCHTAKERQACSWFFNALIDLLNPDKIIAIGGDAHKAVESMGISSVQVRHPSYGGQNVFIRQIEEAYNLGSDETPDLFTQPVG
ncbi:uracil-DNA glycosylase [Marivita sp. S0852]|uniref:uracil-DNA glycosylase n=1 Tax=Marivita sp. S0852 TaxID=3373893 RepID=UPI0039820112